MPKKGQKKKKSDNKGSEAPKPPKPPTPKSIAALIAGMQDYRPLRWVRCGIPAIDLIIGSGFPRGRFVEIMGDPSTAKSALAFVVAGAFQRAGGSVIYMDSELKADGDFAKKLGMDWEAAGHPTIDNLDTAVRLLAKVARTADPEVPTLVVWDSIAGTPGADELDKAESEDGMGAEKAARARHLSAAFRALMGELSRKGVTLLAVNQLRTSFNFMSAYTTLESPGGKAIKFHAAVRLMMKRRGRIRSRDRDLIVGEVIEVEAIKNCVSYPFRKAQIHFKFDTGFVPYSGLDELLLRHGRLTQRAGWLCFRDRNFRGTDLERIASELPDLLDPITAVQEEPQVTVQPTEKAPEENGVVETAEAVEES